MEENGKYYCDECYNAYKKLTPANHIQEPDPYNEEINDDETLCDLCESCYEDSLADI